MIALVVCGIIAVALYGGFCLLHAAASTPGGARIWWSHFRKAQKR